MSETEITKAKTKIKATKDTKPARPAKVEAETEEVDGVTTVKITLTVNGTDVELELPGTFDDADPDAVVALEEERPTVAFKALIGPANWAQLKRLGWTARDFTAVVKAWQGAVGLGNA